jgi:hypothetical protein
MGLKQTAITAYRRAGGLSLIAVERLETGVVYMPGTRANLEDPYALYRRLREKDPFHRSRLVDGWVVSRYADVLEVLRDARFSADDRNLRLYARNRRLLVAVGALEKEEADEVPSMLRLDPPDHTRLRSLVGKAFTPRSIEKLRPRIETIVGELLDGLARKREADLVLELAYPLPVIVIAEMLGVPKEERARFKHWSDEVVRSMGVASFEDIRRSRTAWRELRSYLEGVAEKRRRDPQDDLLSALLAAEERGDTLTAGEVFSTLNLLLIAGNETTTNLIGNGVLALLRNPDELERLRKEPDLVESAVEELLRYDSPVQATSRIATEPTEMHGETVRRGQQLILLIGSANRDPEQFSDPDRLDVARKDNRHLAFGYGIHFCLGAPLARLEATIALRALLERFPRLALGSKPPERARTTILRGLKTLPVRL